MKIALGIILSLFSVQVVVAHSGRTDGSGGHNCNMGYCAGSYHYHYGGDTSVDYDVPEGYMAPSPAPAEQPEPVYEPTITYTTESETEVIPFETITEDSDEVGVGEQLVKQVGVNGEKTITYTITLTDGEETGREKTQEEITKAPVNEIVQNGTKEAEVAVATEPSPEPDPEPLEPSVAETVASYALLGGGGFAGYKYMQRKKKA